MLQLLFALTLLISSSLDLGSETRRWRGRQRVDRREVERLVDQLMKLQTEHNFDNQLTDDEKKARIKRILEGGKKD